MPSNRHKGFTRRDFLRTTGSAALAGTLGFPSIVRAGTSSRKMIVLAMDGMDPALTRKYIKEGRMPNAARLIKQGSFNTVGTSDPPQSPVAWSNFISGTNPGGHGIFDFIARDAETIQPYLSTTRTYAPEKTFKVGKYNIPVSGGSVELLRHGPSVWDLLQDGGVDATAFRAPVNYPANRASAKTIPGITTPDIHGSYGIFSYFTTSRRENSRDVAGGHIEHVTENKGRITCPLAGPANSFVKGSPDIVVPLEAHINKEKSRARIDLQGHRILLRPGEWSDWVRVEFDMIPHLASVTGICRVFLKSLDPHFELYVTPVNIDPASPSDLISHPKSYAAELVDEVGLYYTQGMPEDTAALSAGVFSDAEYRSQAEFVLRERLKFFDHEFNRFKDGFFYFYFSSLDLDSHMFWRTVDKGHPQYTEELFREHGDFLPWLYGQMDQVIGKALRQADENTTIFVISDHGFQSFRRQFNLNSWLMDNGYAAPISRFDREHAPMFMNTEWTATKAYGLGINSLYLNLKGREPEGTIAPGEEADKLRDELVTRLKAVRDPENGEPVITNVFKPEEIYSGQWADIAPDLVVCYNRNYRASWDTVLGKYPRRHLLDNMDPWSGDHCMDAQFLSGILLCNRRIPAANPTLLDMAPSILNHFNLPVPGSMTGTDIFKTA